MAQNYNDLTAPHEGANDEWNDLEVNINDEEDAYNDRTKNTQATPLEYWNTEE